MFVSFKNVVAADSYLFKGRQRMQVDKVFRALYYSLLAEPRVGRTRSEALDTSTAALKGKSGG